jgi:DDE superfamily endonuclease
LLYLPPHISHILQPLDLSIFRAMKALYQKAIRKLIKGDISKVRKDQFVKIYFEIRAQSMSKANVESGWRKSGIYPLNSDQPLNTPFIKEQVARERLPPPESTPKTPIPMRGEPEDLGERDARTQIRDLQKQVKKLEAKNAALATQLAHAHEQITALTVTKKRKKIKVDSNEKLASFKDILNTQAAQDLEAVEEEKRAERRRKRAKK